ncbi:MULTISPECIES: phytanoyl-CoA dioxygenase family protein [unclassified Neorhizobium]|uniref:phytanoyl-CoA dioxygenase family protein n=1 Tax=unclassified Neorhizobium TaxID=2629175 RepID=UPI001FF34941|nr:MULTISPECIES: phytanoyl-CoA dioxygenase family protein [unclassified Neorhizobium]MCJ9668982.1 phytanoyl-CoA dioxygenase family protein [Neorhizobium sp. SHOUNA12B]MCJ9744936.1 phytanoyl-CoA dioxygenase family protein [Neorhizobium sp. SHOUNA12A]
MSLLDGNNKPVVLHDLAHETAVARRRGWKLISPFASKAEILLLKEQLLRTTMDSDGHPHCLYYYDVLPDGKSRLTRVERIWEALTILKSAGLGERIIRAAESYLGCPVVLFKDKLNIRYAGSGGYAPHQDSAAGWGEFAERFVSIGLFLGHSDLFHGGFEVVDEQHNLGRFPNEKGKMTDDLFNTMAPMAVDADMGDALLLDSEAPHRTAHNSSSLDSWHLLFTFAPSVGGPIREEYYERKIQSFQNGKSSNRFEFRVFSF